jgi:SRSO17 transposase
MIIDICPRSVQNFVRSCRPRLSDAQFRHLWTIILAIAVTPRGSKLIHLAAAVLGGRHRTSLGAFLRRDNWDERTLLEDRVHWLIRRMRPRRGEEIQLIIDDTRVLKRGKRMDCLSKIYDYKIQRCGRGHIIIVAAIRFRGVTMPWRIVLWRPKAVAGAGYLKFTEIAADMIRQMPSFGRLRVRVLFDAFYLCPLVVKACESRGFTWFSVAQRSRRFTRDRGLRKAIGELAPGWIRHEGQRVRQRRARRWANLRIAKVQGHLSRIGHVALVASKRVGDPFKNLVVFATNEHRLAAKTIVSIYEQRWAIEILFKELRADLGLCDYQVLEEDAIVRHLHLCCLSHLMLTHHAMEGVGAQAMSKRLESLRTEIRRDQMRRLLRGTRHRRLRIKIEPYFMAAAA